LTSTHWEGRSQIVDLKDHKISLYLDGAHTPESMIICHDWYITKLKDDTCRVLVFNCGNTRDPNILLNFWANSSSIQFDHVIFTTNDTGRTHVLQDKRNTPSETKISWQEVEANAWKKCRKDEKTKIHVVNSLPKLLESLYNIEKEEKKGVQVAVTGSLYLVGGLLEILEPQMLDKL